MPIYIGVNNVAREVKNKYIGVSNVAREVKEEYVGVGNAARLVLGDERDFGKVIYTMSGSGTFSIINGGRTTYTPNNCGITLKKGDYLEVEYYLENLSVKNVNSYSLDGGCTVTPSALGSLGFTNFLESVQGGLAWRNKNYTDYFTLSYTITQDGTVLPTFELYFGGGSGDSIPVASFDFYISYFSVNGHELYS